MTDPLSIAIRQSVDPDERYAAAYLEFQTLFRTKPEADVSLIQLPSHLTNFVYSNRELLGATITGAILAMLDHEKNRGDWSEKSLLELPPIVKEMPAGIRERLDEIILTQGAITGTGLLASDLVMTRVLEWERSDNRKYTAWLRALEKVRKIHTRRTAVPLTDPFWREVKRIAVEQLEPFMRRLKERFSKSRRYKRDEIVTAFEEEAKHPDSPSLIRDNLERWLCFFRREPEEYLHCSPEKLFDEFVAVMTTHKADYVRKTISSPRYK